MSSTRQPIGMTWHPDGHPIHAVCARLPAPYPVTCADVLSHQMAWKSPDMTLRGEALRADLMEAYRIDDEARARGLYDY